jgi:hypothetical protein
MAAADHLTHADHAPEGSPLRDPGVTLRVLVLVLLLAPLNAYFMAYLHGRQVEDPTVVSLFWNVLFALVVLRVLNGILLRFRPKRAFTPAELLSFFILLSVSTANSGLDTFKTTWGTMQGAAVFSDPQNHWESLFGRYLPHGLLVDDLGALDRLWTGGTSFWRTDNLRAWAGPVFHWWLFYLALWSAPIGLAVILRRRWIDSERMGFPIVQVPMDLSRPTILPLGRWIFWIGVGVPVFINLLNGFHVFYPGVPQIPVKIYQTPMLDMQTYLSARPWNAVGMFYLCFYPFIVGLGLLLPADLSLSLWVFFIFWKLEAVFCAQMGWNQTPEFPYMKEQSFGGYIALLVFAIWTARSHLSNVWQAVLGRTGIDENEPLRYRTAVLIFVAGFAYVVAVGISQKMAVWMSIYFFAQYYMMTLIIGRIRAEMGLPTHELERLGPTVTLGNILGVRSLGEQNLTSLSVFFGFTRGMRNIPFPLQLESLYLADRFKLDGKRLLLATILMVAVGQALAWIMGLTLGYQNGLNQPWGIWMPWSCRESWNELAGWLNYPQGVQWGRLEAMVLGFGVYWMMMTARTRWIGFPLHPMGFAIGTTWYMTHMSFPMFIAWTIKTFSTRYLGPKTMADVRALAFGLIVGDVMSGALWILYGLFAHRMTYSFWP